MITRSLVDGAKQTFLSAGVPDSDIELIWVPGSFEIPAVAAKAARSGRFEAIVCLGAVIRGDTPHFDYVASQAASGIMRVSIETAMPIIFGVLTTDTVEQALNRAGLKMGNKGSEAAHTALEMAATFKKMEQWSATK
jgi:6,7-dimethyl-8-ribityllumazine synthase